MAAMAYNDTKLIVDECPDTLGPEHLAQFSEIGCVAFENALTADEITAVRSALTEITCQLLERAHRGEAELRLLRPRAAAAKPRASSLSVNRFIGTKSERPGGCTKPRGM